MTHLLAFFLGLWIGGASGYMIAAIMAVAKAADLADEINRSKRTVTAIPDEEYVIKTPEKEKVS